MSMMLSPRALAATAFAALGLAALAVAGGWTPLRATAAPAPSAGITISSNVPADLVTAAPVASLNDAATFAWNEFFALNWVAAPGKRDTPATACAFGQTGPGCSGPLVWWIVRQPLSPRKTKGSGGGAHGTLNVPRSRLTAR